MKHLSGFGAYRLFLALKSHFGNESYDFSKYRGKVRASKEAYDKRHDKFFFEKLSKQYDAMELRNFFIANIVEGNIYITDMVGDEAHFHFITHQRYKQSMSYKFKEDLELIYKNGVVATFEWTRGVYPYILTLYMQRLISLETLVILDDIIPGYRKKFDTHLKNDIMWSIIRLQIDKMKNFVKYDKDKMSSILRECIYDYIRQKQETKKIPTEETSH
jgi:hypothetical protein